MNTEKATEKQCPQEDRFRSEDDGEKKMYREEADKGEIFS